MESTVKTIINFATNWANGCVARNYSILKYKKHDGAGMVAYILLVILRIAKKLPQSFTAATSNMNKKKVLTIILNVFSIQV